MYLPVLLTALDVIFTIIDILKGTLILSVPFFIVSFFGSMLRKKLTEKYNFYWFYSSLITIFVFSLSFTLIVYLIPLYSGTQAADLGVKPPELQLEFNDHISFLLSSAYRIFLTSLVLTVFFAPFALIGSLLREFLMEKKEINKHLSLFISVFVCCLIGSVLFLFFFGWMLQGMVYLLFFG